MSREYHGGQVPPGFKVVAPESVTSNEDYPTFQAMDTLFLADHYQVIPHQDLLLILKGLKGVLRK